MLRGGNPTNLFLLAGPFSPTYTPGLSTVPARRFTPAPVKPRSKIEKVCISRFGSHKRFADNKRAWGRVLPTSRFSNMIRASFLRSAQHPTSPDMGPLLATQGSGRMGEMGECGVSWGSLWRFNSGGREYSNFAFP